MATEMSDHIARMMANMIEAVEKEDTYAYGVRSGEVICDSSHELLLDGKACPSCRAQV